MKNLYGILVSAFTLSLATFSNADNNSTKDVIRSDRVSMYILMLPESSVENLRNRFRQDEDDGPSAVPNFATTSQYVGQIISGVLGGDVRPIFAGSVKFVEDPNAASGLTSFLGAIAPTLNLALREMYTRTRVALGFAPPTTLRPVEVAQNVTGTGNNVTAYGGDSMGAQKLQTPAPTTAWQYILNQYQQSSTTVEPLPLIKFNKPGLDEDDDGKF